MGKCKCILLLGVVVFAASAVRADLITDWAKLAVYSDGDISVGWRGWIGGDIGARDSIKLGGEANVEGDLFAGDAIVTGWASTFRKAYAELGSSTFDVVTLPPVDTTPTGAKRVKVKSNDTLWMEPGAYGDVFAAWRGHLQLGAGTYYFDSLALDDEATISLDTSAGDVYVYIAGDADLAWRSAIQRDGLGGSLFTVGGEFKGGNESLLDSSLLVGGTAKLGWNSQIAGQLFSYGDVKLSDQSQVGGAVLASVPEPMGALLLVAGLGVLARRR